VLASILLAVLATAVLVAYVRGARARAAAGVPTHQVLVVGKDAIPKGTKAADLASKVTQKTVPEDVIVPGAVSDLAKLQGKVAAIDLQPGEQLTTGRFATPEQVASSGIPAGLQEVTVALDPERAVGGTLRPGDTVGVIASFAPFDFTNTAGNPNAGTITKTPNVSNLILHKILVTQVQMSKVPPAPKQLSANANATTTTTAAATQSPEGSILVTLAVDAPSAERIVFAAEWGKLWLTNEPKSANEGGTKIITWGQAVQ
jgi:pilus assembly protein CpaB